MAAVAEADEIIVKSRSYSQGGISAPHATSSASSPPLRRTRVSSSLRHTPLIRIYGSLNADLVTTAPRAPLAGETITGTSFRTLSGGKGANQAVACARLAQAKPSDASGDDGYRRGSFSDSILPPEVEVQIYGSVGADANGERLRKELRSSCVSDQFVFTSHDESTGVAVIHVEEGSGENRIVVVPGANHAIVPREITEIEPDHSGKRPDLVVMQLEIKHDVVFEVLRKAKRQGIQTLLNPSPAVILPDEALRGLDHLVLNEGEARLMTNLTVPKSDYAGWICSVFEHFRAKGVKNIVLTLGSRGAAFCVASAGGHEIMPAAEIQTVVDTTGAGDTFVGAYAVEAAKAIGRGRDFEIKKAVEFACRAAASSVQRAGAMDSIPWMDEVEDR